MDRSLLREVLCQVVAKIECWFEHVPFGPKRMRSVLDHGVIHVRPDLILSRPVLNARP
jgi:hypothetical protein